MARAEIERQIKQIKEVQKSNLEYLDINYAGLNERGFIMRYGNAILNQYKLWLQSSANDYIRKPGYAGFFDNHLNRYPFTPDSVEKIKADLIAKTNEMFDNIELLKCEVAIIPEDRKWKVTVTVRDTITGIVGVDETGFDVFVQA